LDLVREELNTRRINHNIDGVEENYITEEIRKYIFPFLLLIMIFPAAWIL